MVADKGEPMSHEDILEEIERLSASAVHDPHAGLFGLAQGSAPCQFSNVVDAVNGPTVVVRCGSGGSESSSCCNFHVAFRFVSVQHQQSLREAVARGDLYGCNTMVRLIVWGTLRGEKVTLRGPAFQLGSGVWLPKQVGVPFGCGLPPDSPIDGVVKVGAHVACPGVCFRKRPLHMVPRKKVMPNAETLRFPTDKAKYVSVVINASPNTSSPSTYNLEVQCGLRDGHVAVRIFVHDANKKHPLSVGTVLRALLPEGDLEPLFPEDFPRDLLGKMLADPAPTPPAFVSMVLPHMDGRRVSREATYRADAKESAGPGNAEDGAAGEGDDDDDDGDADPKSKLTRSAGGEAEAEDGEAEDDDGDEINPDMTAAADLPERWEGMKKSCFVRPRLPLAGENSRVARARLIANKVAEAFRAFSHVCGRQHVSFPRANVSSTDTGGPMEKKVLRSAENLLAAVLSETVRYYLRKHAQWLEAWLVGHRGDGESGPAAEKAAFMESTFPAARAEIAKQDKDRKPSAPKPPGDALTRALEIVHANWAKLASDKRQGWVAKTAVPRSSLLEWSEDGEQVRSEYRPWERSQSPTGRLLAAMAHNSVPTKIAGMAQVIVAGAWHVHFVGGAFFNMDKNRKQQFLQNVAQPTMTSTETVHGTLQMAALVQLANAGGSNQHIPGARPAHPADVGFLDNRRTPENAKNNANVVGLSQAVTLCAASQPLCTPRCMLQMLLETGVPSLRPAYACTVARANPRGTVLAGPGEVDVFTNGSASAVVAERDVQLLLRKAPACFPADADFFVSDRGVEVAMYHGAVMVPVVHSSDVQALALVVAHAEKKRREWLAIDPQDRRASPDSVWRRARESGLIRFWTPMHIARAVPRPMIAQDSLRAMQVPEENLWAYVFPWQMESYSNMFQHGAKGNATRRTYGGAHASHCKVVAYPQKLTRSTVAERAALGSAFVVGKDPLPGAKPILAGGHCQTGVTNAVVIALPEPGTEEDCMRVSSRFVESGALMAANTHTVTHPVPIDALVTNLPEEGQNLRGGDVLFTHDGADVCLQAHERGQVVHVKRDTSTEGKGVVVVTLQQFLMAQTGNKICVQMNGQKLVIFVMPLEDMPFCLEDGTTPDMIMSPAGFRRMTGDLAASTFADVIAAELGQGTDCTPGVEEVPGAGVGKPVPLDRDIDTGNARLRKVHRRTYTCGRTGKMMPGIPWCTMPIYTLSQRAQLLAATRPLGPHPSTHPPSKRPAEDKAARVIKVPRASDVLPGQNQTGTVSKIGAQVGWMESANFQSSSILFVFLCLTQP